MKTTFLTRVKFTILFLFASTSFASAQERGLDERINDAFTPVANWWGDVVLHNFPGTSIPTIILLLVGGALFFTAYFGFVNIRRFPTAVKIVAGKFDKLDHHQAGDLELTVEDDIKGIRV